MKNTEVIEHPGRSHPTIKRRPYFDVEMLCAKARGSTSLEDFGAVPVVPALSVLADSLEQEADLHPLGRFLMRTHLLDLLKTRLQLVDAWKKESRDAEDFPITRPIFITGMPRSGSTFLHELLAADPALRAPRVWEVMFPVSASQPDRGWRDTRVWNAAACLWWFRRLAPGADAVYPLRARTPHECVAIHSYTLLSEEFVSCCRIPTYETFLRSSDLRPVYQWQKRFLQHLQQRHPTRRWVLKAPDHVYGLDALFSIFPDALVIQTHRDPLEVLKSTIHLTQVLQRLYGRAANPTELAGREARVLGAAMDRFIRFRDAHPELAGRFIDVNYTELTANPMAVVSRIYQKFNLNLSTDALAPMREMTRKRTRYRGYASFPRLADMGLDPLSQAQRFENYCHRYHIAQRKPASH